MANKRTHLRHTSTYADTYTYWHTGAYKTQTAQRDHSSHSHLVMYNWGHS